MRVFFSLIFISVFNFTYGQNVFTIESTTNAVENIPFDQEFTLKIQDPSSSIDSVGTYQLYMRKGVLQEKNWLGQSADERLNQGQIQKREGGYSYVKMPALKPDLHFEIV